MRGEEHQCACCRVGFGEGEEDGFDEGVVLGVVEEEVGEDQEGEDVCVCVCVCLGGSWWVGRGKGVMYLCLDNLGDKRRGIPTPEISSRKDVVLIEQRHVVDIILNIGDQRCRGVVRNNYLRIRQISLSRFIPLHLWVLGLGVYPSSPPNPATDYPG